jgi:hypothetical protein
MPLLGAVIVLVVLTIFVPDIALLPRLTFG